MSDTELIASYIHVAVCLFGLIGDVFALIIYSRSIYSNTIFSTYFRILCIFDLLSLISKAEYFLKQYQIFDIRVVSNIACKIDFYFLYVLPSISAWMLVIISLDRFVSIFKPFKFLYRKKPKFQLMVCLFLIIINTILFIPILVLTNIDYSFENNETSGANMTCIMAEELVIDWIYVILCTFIPFIIMLISTILTLKILFQSRKNQATNNSLKKKDVKFAFTSILLNILFFILTFPFNFYMIIEILIEIDYFVDNIIYDSLSILYYLNYGTLFYVSYIVNTSFRREFILFLNELFHIKLFESAKYSISQNSNFNSRKETIIANKVN